jgi:dihydrofolate reductase
LYEYSSAARNVNFDALQPGERGPKHDSLWCERTLGRFARATKAEQEIPMPASLLTLVAAVAKNGVIGAAGALPWRLSSDLKRFKAATLGKPVLMGRKTWESLPKRPLADRPNLVLTRDANFRAEGGWTYASFDAALAAGRAMADARGAGEVCVIGGAEIFRMSLPLADRIVLTEVALSPAGDARFPALGADWAEVSREDVEAGPKDDADFVVRVLERR